MPDDKKPFDLNGFMARALGPSAKQFNFDPERAAASATMKAATGSQRLVNMDRAEQLRIARELDVKTMRDMIPFSCDEAALCAIHKARYELREIEDELRHASRAWLEENGFQRLRQLPWPPAGVLPRDVSSE